MSSISSISSSAASYQPAAPKPAVAAPKVATAPQDADHDGDTDGKGIDVKG